MVPIQTQKGIIGQTAISVTTRILAKFSQLREENLQLKLDLIIRTCMRLFLVASPHSGLAIAKRRCLIINLIRVDMMSLLVNGGTQLPLDAVGIVTNIHRCARVSENAPASDNIRGEGGVGVVRVYTATMTPKERRDTP